MEWHLWQGIQTCQVPCFTCSNSDVFWPWCSNSHRMWCIRGWCWWSIASKWTTNDSYVKSSDINTKRGTLILKHELLAVVLAVETFYTIIFLDVNSWSIQTTHPWSACLRSHWMKHHQGCNDYYWDCLSMKWVYITQKNVPIANCLSRLVGHQKLVRMIPCWTFK